MAESLKLREEEVVSSPNVDAATTPGTCEVEAEVESSPSAEPELKVPEVAEVVLQRLARQVEYYFSTSNLSKDTYVCTLRSLNDGYVPVSIIANFGKVKALVPYDAINAVGKAAADCSDLLEVVQINPETGKRVRVAADENSDADSPLNTIEAVGPISGEPIPVSQIPLAPASPLLLKPVVAAVQNTVIIRDVPEGTDESQVRELFTFDKCPSLQSLHLDVANCWFVTLDTESRDDVLNVMFELVKMKFASGEPVKARLKSGVVMISDIPSNIGFVPTMYPPHSSSPNRYYNNGGRKNKKKKNSPNKSRTNNANANTNAANSQNKITGGKVKTSNNNGGTRRNNGGKQKKAANGQERPQQEKPEGLISPNASTKEKAPSLQVPPPTLGEEQFPALPTEDPIMNSTNTIEMEKVPEHRHEDDLSYDELEKNRANSDSASTATTTSSSSSKQQATMGGYAAALLKAAPPPKTTQTMEKETRPTKADKNEKKTETKEKKSESARPKEETTKAVEQVFESVPVLVQPPSWGGGRSFADVLRKETAATVAAAPEQSA